jgi:hypothetical protein
VCAAAAASDGHPLGADPVAGGVRFGIWAPRAAAVEVVIEGTEGYLNQHRRNVANIRIPTPSRPPRWKEMRPHKRVLFRTGEEILDWYRKAAPDR